MSDSELDQGDLEKGALLALLTVGYAACAILCIPLFRLGNGAVGVWVPNVLAVAMMVRNAELRSKHSVVAVLVGCLAANLLIGSNVDKAIVYALANSTTVWAEATLLRWQFRRAEEPIGSAADYTTTLALGGLAGPAVGATVFAGLATVLFGWPFASTVARWLAGEALSFAILLPFALLVSARRLAELARPARLLRMSVAAGASIALAIVAGNSEEVPFVLVMVPLLIATAWAEPFELALTGGAVCTVLVGLALGGVLSSAGLAPNPIAYGFHLSVAVVAIAPFAISLLVARQRLDAGRLAESEQRFRRAMDDSAIGIVIVGLDGTIAETNRAFAQMLDYESHQLRGMTFFQITHPDDLQIGAETMKRVRDGEAESLHFEKRYVRKDGRPVWARLAGSVIRDGQTGTPLYLVSQVEDIDAAKRSAAAVAEAENRWSFALASAGQGMWDLDTRKGRVTYSATWKEMLGYAPDELDGDPDYWLTLVHPDDRARVEAADRAHTEGRTDMFEAEFRMRHKDGRWIWILDRGMVVERDRRGSPVRLIGTLTDITARRETEERVMLAANQLSEEKERLRVTLDAIGDAVICTDAVMRVTFMNPVAERLTGVTEASALSRPVGEVYAPIDEETGERIATAPFLAALKQRVEHNNRAVLGRKDGSRCLIREVVSPILSERGDFNGCVIVFQDFTDARELQRRLAYAAAHDSLTGLANRANLIAAMGSLMSSPRPDFPPDLLFYVDLDNFKAVNDGAGHAAGDRLLRRVAETIRATTRSGDIVARLGGDEFAVLMRGCSLETGTAMARNLVAAIRVLAEPSEGVAPDFGASVGVTAIAAWETEVEDVVARADRACYEAKAEGKGRVVAIGAPDRTAMLPKAS